MYLLKIVSFVLSHLIEDTTARCQKYSSKLDISRSLIRIFAIKWKNLYHID